MKPVVDEGLLAVTTRNISNIDLISVNWRGMASFRVLLTWTICLFLCSFVVGMPSKLTNGIFYGLIALPTIALLIWQRPSLLPWARKFAWLLVFLACAMVSDLIVSGGGSLKGFKYPFYLIIYVLALSLIAGDRRHPKAIVITVGVVGMAVLALTCLNWIDWALKTGHWNKRMTFNDFNSSRSALLIFFSIVVLWLFVVEPKLAKLRSRSSTSIGLISFVMVVMIDFVVFQSRSTLVALLLFLAAYAIFREQWRSVIVVSCSAAVLMWALGADEVVYQRGISYRSDIWSDVLANYLGKCDLLFGCGLNDETLFAGHFQNPHSGYLSTLYYHGAVTASAFLIMAASVAWRAYRGKDNWFLASLAGWGGALASSSGFIDSPESHWAYFWLPVVFSVLYSTDPPETTC